MSDESERDATRRASINHETVAQARRARIAALNELIRELGGIELDIRSFVDKHTDELARLLDHEEAPDPEEAGGRITEAARLSNEEEVIDGATMYDKITELEKRIGDREQQIARLLDTVASQEAAIRDYQDENSTFQERNHKLTEQVDNLSSKVVQLNQVIDQVRAEQDGHLNQLLFKIDQKDTQISLQEDQIEGLQASVARQSETIKMQANMLAQRAAEIGTLQKVVEARDDEIARIVDQDTEAERWKKKCYFLQDAVDSRVRVVADQQKQIVELHRSCDQLKALLREIKAEALEGYAQKIERIVERGEDY